MNIYSTCSPLNVGCFLYTDSLLLIPVSDGVYYDGTTCWVVVSGQIDSSTSCITTTTTLTPPPATYCYTDGGTTYGPFPDLPTCEAAAGGNPCFECI